MFLWNLETNRQKYTPKLQEKRIEIFEEYKKKIAEDLSKKFEDVIHIPYGTVDWLSRNYPIVVLKDRSFLRKIVEYIKNELGFNYLNYITAVDYYLHNVFHVVYEFTKIPLKTDSLAVEETEIELEKDIKVNLNFSYRLRLIVVLDRDDPKIDSIEDIYRTADWHERETYDLFGIVFQNRINPLERILMPNEWEGFPLRKDFFHERIIPHPFLEAYYVVKKVKELEERK
ncbi:MAG: NADH-quinone oxidoreductase subunit C [Candidatus Calescibacterium sp.]|nr:NADH-quinone oxidoreductase subunit C [Candidatus Calescibacterium sp.]MCX7972423.1 NADH-quinone oxidoreductase subunit C [bacterium]MDW8195686.1 NADH-quinone oxidoreductase subunit C [Candidatus Calescibacterium sp.]